MQTPAAAAVLRLALFDQLPDPCTWKKQTRASGSGGAPAASHDHGVLRRKVVLVCGLVLSGANFQSEVTVSLLV